MSEVAWETLRCPECGCLEHRDDCPRRAREQAAPVPSSAPEAPSSDYALLVAGEISKEEYIRRQGGNITRTVSAATSSSQPRTWTLPST